MHTTLPAWREVEEQIAKEINWFKSVIDTYGDKSKDTAGKPVCNHCTLRTIALLIIYGDVQAQEITKEQQLDSFWLDANTLEHNLPPIQHGKDWHQEKMTQVENHFISLGFDVEREPHLHFGRADLGVYVKGEDPLFVEVGTTSYFKLAANLKAMQNFVYLIVPDDERLIEFRKINSVSSSSVQHLTK